MQIIRQSANVFGNICTLELMEFNEVDGAVWKQLFDQWKGLKMGMRNYKSREPNFPEGLSEVAFCLYSGSQRFIKKVQGVSSASYDTYNPETRRAEQIKACSVSEDLTSFGPRSRWDDLYFLDFYNNNLLDGRFNVYKIPSDLIYNMRVNRNQTMREQQAEGRRPRFSIIKDIIRATNLEPVARNVQVW